MDIFCRTLSGLGVEYYRVKEVSKSGWEQKAPLEILSIRKDEVVS